MDAGEASPTRLLSVCRAGTAGSLTDALRELPLPLTVTSADSVAALRATLAGGDGVDCIVTRFDLPDGTGAEVFEHVVERRPDVPVVLLVEPTDGQVPVDAVTHDFAACLPTADGVPPRDRLTEAVSAVRSTTASSPEPSAAPVDWTSDAWKASVLDQLFDTFPLHVYVKDRDARIVFVTEGPVSERIHPSGEEFQGRRDVDGVVPLDEAISSYADDLQVLETGEPVVDREEFFPSAKRWFLTSKIPLHDEHGVVVGLLGVARETTDRRERERQLSALGHLVRHNLRTDVNVLKGWAETLEREVAGTARQSANRIVRASDRLHSTVRNQQDVVDLLTDNATPGSMDAAAVVRQVVTDAADAYPHATFECHLPETAPARAIDRFGRAIEELVENSVTHNPQETPSVAVSVEPLAETVRIRVVDDAPTIPELEVSILTGERDIEPLSHSTGLGLWLVNWIVKQSGGTLSFDENHPRGNVVTVAVPAPD